MVSWVNLHDVTQLTKHGTVNTTNRNPWFDNDNNVSCMPTEPVFTPMWREWTAKKAICMEKRILRESKAYLEYLIIKQHVLTSPTEKVDHFGLGGRHCADRHLQDARSRDHTENRPRMIAFEARVTAKA